MTNKFKHQKIDIIKGLDSLERLERDCFTTILFIFIIGCFMGCGFFGILNWIFK